MRSSNWHPALATWASALTCLMALVPVRGAYKPKRPGMHLAGTRRLTEEEEASAQGSTLEEIATGTDHSCVVMQTGSESGLRCWGYNQYGQLGYEDTELRGSTEGTMGAYLPYVDLGRGGGSIESVVLGYAHTCVLFSSKQVKCFGRNNRGQLGYGDTQNRGSGQSQMGNRLPFVDVGEPVELLTSSGSSVYALTSSGHVKAWGGNFVGQLGYGDTVARGSAPFTMGANLSAVNLGAGLLAWYIQASFPEANQFSHVCAILVNFRVKCWGYGASGRLGYGDTANRGATADTMGENLPFVDLGTNSTGQPIQVWWMTMTSGGTCAAMGQVQPSVQVKCWGESQRGQLGYGATVTTVGTSTTEMGDSLPFLDFGMDPIWMHAGGDHVCALAANQSGVKCWGWGISGRLGYENENSLYVIADVPFVNTGMESHTDLQLGFTHTCAESESGGLKCWGAGFFGQLGMESSSTFGSREGTMGSSLPWVNICPSSDIFDPQTGVCSFCPAGSVPQRPNLACSPCALGLYSLPGDSACRECGPGQIRADQTAAECEPCPVGQVPDVNHTQCVGCPPGSFAPSGADRCFVCRGPEVAVLATGTCEVCEPGSIPDMNRVVCLPCPPGTYGVQNATQCTPCPPGLIAQHGYGECQPCDGGFVPDPVRGACVPCLAGFFAAPGDARCMECEDGEFSSMSSSSCTTCTAWLYILDRDAEDCLVVFLMCLGAAVLQFLCLWFILGMFRGPIKITDITEVEGKIIITCNRWHGLKTHDHLRCRVTFKRTGIMLLDEPQETLEAVGLDEFRLEIVGLKSMENVDVESSMGTMVPERVLVRHCPAALSLRWAYVLVALRTVVLFALPWLLLIYDSRDASSSVVTVLVGIAIGTVLALAVCAKVWLWRTFTMTPLQRRHRFFLSSQRRQLRRSTACGLGPERGVRVQELIEFSSVFKDYLAHRSVRYFIDNIVKPLTAKEQLSLAELVGAKTLTYFASAPDDMCFDEVVQTIAKHSRCVHEAEWRSLSYWMRAWSVNFWSEDVEMGLGVWNRSAMYRAITSPQCLATCLITDLDGSPLRRSWCLADMIETFRRQRETSAEEYDGIHLCTNRGVLGVGDEPHFDHAIGLGRSLAVLNFDESIYRSRDEDAALRHLISAEGGADRAGTFLRRNLWQVLEATEPDVYWDGLCAKRETKTAASDGGSLRDLSSTPMKSGPPTTSA